MDKVVYRDGFGNTATIEEVMTYPYRGASDKEKAYRLSIYEDDFLYHVSVHETIENVIGKLSTISCGTFKKI